MDTDQQSTAEMMALAVLRKDWQAARELADMLQMLLDPSTEKQLMPVRIIQAKRKNIRVAVFFDGQYLTDNNVDAPTAEENQDAVDKWLDNPTGALGLVGVDRIEIYELRDEGDSYGG